MKDCAVCGEKREKLNICPQCHRWFCNKHFKEIDHDCQGDNYNLDLY